MPRRNNRRERFEPLDLTPADVRAHSRSNPPTSYVSPAEARRARAQREQERAERQRNARINGGIDWSVCLVPGCGEELRHFGKLQHLDTEWRNHELALPLCDKHLVVAHRQAVIKADDPLIVNVSLELQQRREAKHQEIEERQQREWLELRDGHIYFVRLNGLVKVGWSREVSTRLRAYGPEVEVLAVYPATRDDETYLHRQLRPVLARGREWYEDGKVIADFVARAVAEHGEPNVSAEWTKPKQVVKPKRWSA